MSVQSGFQIREVVDWGAGECRRRRLGAELERIVATLPQLGVRRAILFGSLARGDIGGQSDLDLIFIVDTSEPFVERCGRFYQALAPAVGMDLLVYTSEEFESMRERLFLRHALRDAKVIYEA
jgi:predicted nucleotidyltransferase